MDQFTFGTLLIVCGFFVTAIGVFIARVQENSKQRSKSSTLGRMMSTGAYANWPLIAVSADAFRYGFSNFNAHTLFRAMGLLMIVSGLLLWSLTPI